ncbi:RNA helicase [Pseudogymnoascus australis]
MVLATQRGGVCLFCTFRSAELRLIRPTTTNVKRQFSTGSVQSGILDDLLSPTRNPPSSTGNEQKDTGRGLGIKRKEGRGAIYDGSNPPRFAPANKARKREPKTYQKTRRDGFSPRKLYEERKKDPVIRSAGKGAHSLLLGSNFGQRSSDQRSSDERQLPVRSPHASSSHSIFGNGTSRRGFANVPLEIIYNRVIGEFKDLRSELVLAYDPQGPAGSGSDGFTGLATVEEFTKMADDFAASLTKSYDAASLNGVKNFDDASLFNELRQVLIIDAHDLPRRIKYLFTKFVCDAQVSPQTLRQQQQFVDLRYPIEWFPATRALQRKVHLHVGPTNSGKTFHALQRLEQAQSGLYAGPLRLLAHEVYSRLNAKGKPCSLITGEERRFPEGPTPTMSSCTVEMVPLNTEVEVAVIDEIQMISDGFRGWAWTQAFLGVKAREIHICGELRTIPLIQNLCKLLGDELTIHRYERLTPLECMGKSLNGKLDRLKKGDCIILFSRVAIHAMKKEVERATGKRCAVVYGSLPPETRAQQAALFNDPDNEYDYLVASDAVGMGLNLAIRRVIFESLSKFDGKSHSNIPISEIKQIAGRAGRYKTAAEAIKRADGPTGEISRPVERNVGLATTLDTVDHVLLKQAMSTDVEPLKTAGIFPPSTILQKFAAYFPKGTPLSYIMLRLNELATLNPMFTLCDYNEQLLLADMIEPFNLTLQDQLVFIAAPANVKRREQRPIIEALAAIIANRSSTDLLEIPALDIELLDETRTEGKEYLSRLEALHQGITLYLWLSYRFAGVFRSQALAFHIKSLVEEKINESLAKVPFEEHRRRMIQALKLKAIQKQAEADALTAMAVQPGLPTPMSYEDEDRQEPLIDVLDEETISDEALAEGAEDDDEYLEAPLNTPNAGRGGGDS